MITPAATLKASDAMYIGKVVIAAHIGMYLTSNFFSSSKGSFAS